MSAMRSAVSRALHRVAERVAPTPGYTLNLEYAPTASLVPRYGYGKEAHPRIDAILRADVDRYRDVMHQFLQFEDDLRRIPLHGTESAEPCWVNEWLIGLDTVSLYSFARLRQPARYVEVGSGQSTKVVARAKRDGAFDMQIVSIDPSPRAEVDALCDIVLRSPLETVDLGRAFTGLKAGDIVFFDGSHRVLPNSDCVAFFLDVLPSLPSGVLVGIHDIYLPNDYPDGFIDLWWSEQYLLAAYLLARAPWMSVVLPNFFTGECRELTLLDRLWRHPGFETINPRGSAFWLEIK